MKIKKRYFLYFLVLLVFIITLFDYIRISNYKPLPSLPSKESADEIKNIYFDLANNKKEIDWSRLNNSLNYVDSQYDVSDFRLAPLVRILYDYPQQIPDSIKTRIKKTVLNFRYWMDEPGENSMCYWSENHQILFASAEYLLGQLYPNDVFTNSGLTGQQHMIKAEKRIKDWMRMRWNYGFSEFYSNVYYSEDIGGMINIIDYAKNDSISNRMMMIMDLLVYDVAAQNIGDMFVSTSGRAYERSRKGGSYANLGGLTNFIFHSKPYTHSHMTYGFVKSKKYHVPPVLIDIGKDTGKVVVKQSNGLNISELKDEGYYGTDNRSIMMHWGMEAFTNPEVIKNTMDYIRKNNMFSNAFLTKLSEIDYTAVRIFNLEPVISRILKSPSDGFAIQKANTYTYKTKYYTLYTVQRYWPGDYADQQHVCGMNIGNSFSIFHTHPAYSESYKDKSPSYWVGYGHLPDAVQDSSISLAIYNLPNKKGMLEKTLLYFTHAYFPTEKFDTIIINNNYAFGKKGDTYCVFIGRNNFSFKKNSTDDLIQNGKKTFWITEAGSKEDDGSFNNFYKRILQNKLSFDTSNVVLQYYSKNKKYKLKYKGDFSINDSVVNTKYARYDSPYIKSKRKAKSFEFQFHKKFLYLNFDKMERNYN